MDHPNGLEQAHGIWKNLLTEAQMTELGIAAPEDHRDKRHKPNRQPKKKTQADNAMELLLHQVARLALRTEASVKTLLQDFQFVLHLEPGQGSLIPILLAKSQQWHQGDRTVPLRHLLVTQMLQTLLDRLDALSKTQASDDMQKECQEMGLINSQGMLPYPRWDPQTKKLKESKETPLSLQETMKAVQNAHRLAQEIGTTNRFHALTKVANDGDRSIPWLWTVTCRANGEMWSELKRLCWHSIWRLIRAQIRPQTLDRSHLEKDIVKALNGTRSAS